jgi:transmembrane sensor
MTVSLVLSGLVIAVVASLFWLMQAKTTTTAVGEQRRIALDDGSNVLLDSGTRISVRYDRRLRRVQLLSGEALFDVAKQPDWPFIVQVGDRQVRAVGTTFSVSRDNDRMVVTLVKGIVTVSSDARFRLPLVGTPQAAQGIAGDGEVLTLSPGERLTFAAGAAPSVDRPSLDQTMAWVRGQVVFDNTPLSRAAAEMNRYSAVRLTIDANDAEQLPVSGVFQLGASESFARAVAQLYGLAAVAGGGEIRLSGEPKLPTRVGAAKAARS